MSGFSMTTRLVLLRPVGRNLDHDVVRVRYDVRVRHDQRAVISAADREPSPGEDLAALKLPRLEEAQLLDLGHEAHDRILELLVDLRVGPRRVLGGVLVGLTLAVAVVSLLVEG